MSKKSRRNRRRRQGDNMKRYALDRLIELSELSDNDLLLIHGWSRYNLNEAIREAKEDDIEAGAMRDMYGDEADYLMENMPDIGNQ